ncbi:MAG: SOS response-associated peptidase [Rhizobiales bacterium]|nr:SOS response-associated peptidase [Hyphomicrobiales bacterium]
MCSRYNLTTPPEAVRQVFRFINHPNFPPRYNIAPSQPAGIVRIDHDGERRFTLVRWGLIPSWAKDLAKLPMMINARSETVLEKPSFRAAMRHRRCIVPADGFYEWSGPKSERQPHLFAPASGGPMGLAGLWETWLGADGSEIDSMAILTTQPNRLVAAIHDRMPVILAPQDFDAWLDCRGTDAREAANLMRAAPDDFLSCRPVNRALNNARNEGPELIASPDGELF